eukprot:15197698-Alexandrium_andersonii.AAC.1
MRERAPAEAILAQGPILAQAISHCSTPALTEAISSFKVSAARPSAGLVSGISGARYSLAPSLRLPLALA